MYNYINFDVNHFADLFRFIEHKHREDQKMLIEAELNDLTPVECRRVIQEIIEAMDSMLFFDKKEVIREYLWKSEPGKDNCYSNITITVYATYFDQELAESAVAEAGSITDFAIYLTGFKVNLPEKVEPQLNDQNNCGKISDAGFLAC